MTGKRRPSIHAGDRRASSTSSSNSFPSRRLNWHYRSRHQSLIAFSNRHFYQDSLVVFPSPYPNNATWACTTTTSRTATMRAGRTSRGNASGRCCHQSHAHESRPVVGCSDAWHHTARPHRNAFREAESELPADTGVPLQVGEQRRHAEPFFIKNLENVQGDERDVIYISTTFGPKDGTGPVAQNFGPISKQAGWRRLNVLFTRAKHGVHLFTSMRPEDIVVDLKTPQGTRALRNYIEYARSGVLEGADPTEREPDSDFEVSVADVLREKGFEVVPQLGVAGFFIDLAVRNPYRQGEYLAAIECDGQGYHSGASVRDRDRIRQEILEGLGWKGKIFRIWSTDWYRNRATQVRNSWSSSNHACKMPPELRRPSLLRGPPLRRRQRYRQRLSSRRRRHLLSPM